MTAVGRKSTRNDCKSGPGLAEVRRLADSQSGVVSRAQLYDAGLSKTHIDTWIRRGRLRPLFTGAFGLGHSALRREGCFIAAVLGVGEGSVLSHRSAAFHWRLLDERGDLIDVTT